MTFALTLYTILPVSQWAQEPHDGLRFVKGDLFISPIGWDHFKEDGPVRQKPIISPTNKTDIQWLIVGPRPFIPRKYQETEKEAVLELFLIPLRYDPSHNKDSKKLPAHQFYSLDLEGGVTRLPQTPQHNNSIDQGVFVSVDPDRTPHLFLYGGELMRTSAQLLLSKKQREWFSPPIPWPDFHLVHYTFLKRDFRILKNKKFIKSAFNTDHRDRFNREDPLEPYDEERPPPLTDWMSAPHSQPPSSEKGRYKFLAQWKIRNAYVKDQLDDHATISIMIDQKKNSGTITSSDKENTTYHATISIEDNIEKSLEAPLNSIFNTKNIKDHWRPESSHVIVKDKKVSIYDKTKTLIKEMSIEEWNNYNS